MESLTTILQSLPALAVAVLKATLVLAILQLLLKGVPRLSASARHLILVTGLAAFLVFPLFSVIVPAWDLPILPRAEAAAYSPLDDPALAQIDDGAPNAITVTGRRIGGMPGITASSAPAASENPARSAGLPWRAITAYAWMTVALLLLARLGIGFLRVWWIVRTAEPVPAEIAAAVESARVRVGLDREVRLLASAFVRVPMVTGLARPTLLLPTTTSEWPADLRELVLVHEMAHLKRWDTVTLVLTQFLTALYWFHPQVWAASNAARRECERACDDLVLIAGARPSEYAGHLLSMVRIMPGIESLGAVSLGISERSQLEGRLLAILHPSLRRGRIDARVVALAAIAAILVMAPLSAARLTVRGTEPDGAIGLISFQESEPMGGQSVTPSPDPVPVGDPQPDRLRKDDRYEKPAPTDGDGWYELGMKLHRSDRYEEAIEAFGRAASAGTRPAGSMYNIACGFAMMNHRDQALTWLERSIEAGFRDFGHIREDSDLDPIRSDPRFQALLAKYPEASTRSKRSENRLARALERFESLRSTRSSDGEKWSDVGVDLLRLRRLDDAVFALERATEHLGPRGQTALYNLACAHALRGNERAALQALRLSIEAGFDGPDKIRRDPDLASLRGSAEYRGLVALAEDLSLDAHAGEQRGKSPYSVQRWAPAAAHFETFVQSHPASGRGWYNLGWARHYSNEFARAIEAFDRARQLGYREGTSMYNMACGYAKLGRAEEAVNWLERSQVAGFELHDYLWDDEDLQSLHGNPRFEALATRVDERAHGAERKKKKNERRTALEMI